MYFYDAEAVFLREIYCDKGHTTSYHIPFDELELIEVVTKEGFLIPIIKNGKFVLDGTQELNKALNNSFKNT